MSILVESKRMNPLTNNSNNEDEKELTLLKGILENQPTTEDIVQDFTIQNWKDRIEDILNYWFANPDVQSNTSEESKLRAMLNHIAKNDTQKKQYEIALLETLELTRGFTRKEDIISALNGIENIEHIDVVIDLVTKHPNLYYDLVTLLSRCKLGEDQKQKIQKLIEKKIQSNCTHMDISVALRFTHRQYGTEKFFTILESILQLYNTQTPTLKTTIIIKDKLQEADYHHQDFQYIYERQIPSLQSYPTRKLLENRKQ
jgi:hypothetical protein